MKAALISLGSTSSKITAEAMQKYFSEVEMVDLRKIEVKLGKDSGIYYHGEPFKNYDCVYLKGSFRYAHLQASISTMLEKQTAYMPLPSHAYTTIHNKLLTHLALQQHNIPMPKTYISSNVEEAKRLLDHVTYPIVMKFPEGTQGKGVMFADSKSSAASLLDALGALNQPFIIQQFIDTGGSDVRAFVVGNRVVASMKRTGKQDDKRANLHAGGTGDAIILSPKAHKIAIDTAKALGSDILGVDILESEFGPMVIEANLSPGLQGLNKISKIDVPDAIAKYLYQQTETIVKKTNKKAAATVMQDLGINNSQQQLITNLQFRGGRALLPQLITNMGKLTEEKEYTIKASKGKVTIEEF